MPPKRVGEAIVDIEQKCHFHRVSQCLLRHPGAQHLPNRIGLEVIWLQRHGLDEFKGDTEAVVDGSGTIVSQDLLNNRVIGQSRCRDRGMGLCSKPTSIQRRDKRREKFSLADRPL
jgi:hypothetical protein